MSLETLERDILKDVAAASDEAALEALRVAALGKKGSISERMKSLGGMAPDAAQGGGCRAQSPEGQGCRGDFGAQDGASGSDTRKAPGFRKGRCHLAGARRRRKARSIR